MYMPRMDGLKLPRQMRALDMHVPVLMLTGNQSTRAAIDAVSAEVCSYMSKPLEPGAPEAVAPHRRLPPP